MLKTIVVYTYKGLVERVFTDVEENVKVVVVNRDPSHETDTSIGDVMVLGDFSVGEQTPGAMGQMPSELRTALMKYDYQMKENV